MKVYDLIRRRYLAQFLPHLETDKTVATLQSGGHTLVARGNVIVAQGWRILFGKNVDEETGNDDEKQGLPVLTKISNAMSLILKSEHCKLNLPHTIQREHYSMQ